MNTTHEVLTGSVLPCGCATEVVGVGHVHPEELDVRPQGRMAQLKSTAIARLDQAQRSVTRTSSNVRRGAMEKVDQLRHRAALMTDRARYNTSQAMASTQSSMRENPMKWAGIAAGAGLGIGLLGRLMDHRRHHRRMSPQLVVIETEC